MSTVATDVGAFVLEQHELLATVQAALEAALVYADLTAADRELLTKAAQSVEMADADLCQVSMNH